MAKTNTGLVEYAKAQLGKPYWYGTFGNTATQSLLSAKAKQYPSHYGESRMPQYRSQLGERVHDCVGLIKGYLWSETPTSKPKYNSAQDVSANGMYSVCKEKGKINTLPEIPGTLVFMPCHVGIYIGGGKVIEARGFNYGVVKTDLKSRGWQTWGKCPWISYENKQTTKPNANYFKRYTGKSVSIVDALKSIGADSSFSSRRKIAAVNGITGYIGTANQNTLLLSKLKSGLLIKP